VINILVTIQYSSKSDIYLLPDINNYLLKENPVFYFYNKSFKFNDFNFGINTFLQFSNRYSVYNCFLLLATHWYEETENKSHYRNPK